MKTNFATPTGFLRSSQRAAVAAALLLFGTLAASSQAATLNFPNGTWDCLLSGGGQQGIAFITFSNDFTLNGLEILVPKPPSGGGSSDGRNPGGGAGRGGSGRSGGTTGARPGGTGRAPARQKSPGQRTAIGRRDTSRGTSERVSRPNPESLASWFHA